MLRDITIGQHFPGTSLVHRFDPRMKLVLTIVYIVLLFAALVLKIIPVSAVKDVSTFLLEIMPMLFIPAAAGLLEAWGILEPNLAAYIVITLVATVAVMAVSGLVTQFLVRKGKKNG